MCGIVGVLSTHEVAPLLVESLKRLEYRGYDSAGIATVDNGMLGRRRTTGKLANLSDLLEHEPLPGKAGIGHTHWATHGAATVANAHQLQATQVMVVHNGIIENYRELRDDLTATGYQPESDTDTEVLVLLAQRFLDEGLTPREAAARTIERLEGAYALCFLFAGEDDLMIAARKGSPLVLGWGEGEMFVGSDAIALAPLTDRVTYLQEGDRVEITRAGVVIFDIAGHRADRAEVPIQLTAAQAEKGGYNHFMMKEITEQPVVLAEALQHYADLQSGTLKLPPKLDFSAVSRLVLVACGTAGLAGQVAKYWFEDLAGIPCDIDIASEFRYRDPVLDPHSLAIFVSQSGETADTLAALRHVNDRIAGTVAVVNVASSSIADESRLTLPILAGAEVGVASTKAFTNQLLVLLLMALKAGLDRGRLDAAQVAAHLAALTGLPGFLAQVLALDRSIQAMAPELAKAQDVLFLGRGTMYPIALEGALKLKETSYIHAEGYAAGELKHGPIALIEPEIPLVMLAPRNALFDKAISNMQEVIARGAKVLLISDREGVASAGDGTWQQLALPEVPPLLAPILYAVPLQLLAYHTAVAKGTDVDQPRNLTKAVTVE